MSSSLRRRREDITGALSLRFRRNATRSLHQDKLPNTMTRLDQHMIRPRQGILSSSLRRRREDITDALPLRFRRNAMCSLHQDKLLNTMTRLDQHMVQLRQGIHELISQKTTRRYYGRTST